MTTHRLDAAPDTVHWGFFDAALKPLITVEPGDEVMISTVSGPAAAMPKADSGLKVPPALAAIHASVPQKLNGPHIMTGPIAVRGAKAGQVLEIRIKAIDLNYDWGYNAIRPLAGALPDDFETTRLIHIPLDRARMMARLPWGLELPLQPFFGVMAVAPPPAWGPVASPPPRRNGGNIDNKELVAGTTLYLPVPVEGALLSAGDGHGAQGDGEVSGTAIECPLERAQLTLELQDGPELRMPVARTADAWLAFGFDEDLDVAAELATETMLDVLEREHGLERRDAYGLASVVVDLHVTQVVNGVKGVHAVLRHDAIRI